MLLQYFFQCQCPAASEEARYSKEAEVIVSACRHDYSLLSPSGRLLYVRYKALAYFLNLQTGERIDASTQTSAIFLTDNLGFIEDGIEDYIIDRTTGKKYPIKAFRFWRENAYINGNPDLELLVNNLHQAEQVFLTSNYSTVVVLMPKFFTDSKQSFTFSLSDIPEREPGRVEKFLQENNISYRTIVPRFPHEVISPDGRMLARDDGIYIVETASRIVKAPITSFVSGWTYDGRGAIYAASRSCLLTGGFLFADDTWCKIEVPLPVLLLKVPEESLPLTPTP